MAEPNETRFGEMVEAIFGARRAAEDGKWCTCDEPDIATVPARHCWACNHTNQDAEREACRWIVAAHDWMPHPRLGDIGLCGRCAHVEEHPRHHGVNGVARTSWGEEVRP